MDKDEGHTYDEDNLQRDDRLVIKIPLKLKISHRQIFNVNDMIYAHAKQHRHYHV